MKLIDALAGAGLTGRYTGAAASAAAAAAAAAEREAKQRAGMQAAEGLIQCSYELQYGFSFASVAAAIDESSDHDVSDEVSRPTRSMGLADEKTAQAWQESEMRQLRLFAHAASLVFASSAVECRAALRRTVHNRLPGLSEAVAAAREVATKAGGAEADEEDGLALWTAVRDAALDTSGINREDSSQKRREDEAKAAVLMQLIWRCLVEVLSEPPPEWAAPRICFCDLQLSGRSIASPRMVIASLPFQLKLRLHTWNVPVSSLACRVTLMKKGQTASAIALPLAELQLLPAVDELEGPEEDGDEQQDDAAEKAAAGSAGARGELTASAAVILPQGLRGLYAASVSVVRCFGAEIGSNAAAATAANSCGIVAVSAPQPMDIIIVQARRPAIR